MPRALVVGNGESRRYVDFSTYADHVLIGCNAIHRDLNVDHLICCDRRMAEEAVNNSNTKDTAIYVRDHWHHYFRKIRKNKNINLLPDVPTRGELKKDQGEHWGSGGFNEGDVVWNNYPISGKFVGWVCTKAGSPGIWNGFGRIE